MNEELSFQIANSLKAYGTVVSVKTARDNEGRPYSFVQFQQTESAKEVLKRKLNISIGGRKVRIEKAKCLRKLQISVSILSPQSIHEVKRILSDYSEIQDILQFETDGTIPEINEAGARPKFSFTIKLKEDLNADEAFLVSSFL